MTDRSIPDIGATHLTALEGGVSDASVWRGRLDDREVVIKRTSGAEIAVVQLIMELGESMLPRLLFSGVDDLGPWMVLPFHPGKPAGITAGLPAEVHRCIGRLHAHFMSRVGELPLDLERLDETFVDRALTEFGPAVLQRAESLLSIDARLRAVDLLEELAADPVFRSTGALLPATLLHGDLYGMNVILPTPHRNTGTEPLIIDWNAARVGPAMFDVAMSADYDSASRRAHHEGWREVAGRLPDEHETQLAHAWSSALINIMYAGVVAVRASADAGVAMIAVAERSAARFNSLS
ncbi:MAG TPA: aminoglycoside phosphotransferase family protein [Microlunatus sp.]